MSDPLDAAALLAQLEAERADIDVTIANMRRRMGMPTNGDAASPAGGPITANAGRDTPITGRVRSDEFFRLSIADAIAKYLTIMKQPQNPGAVVAGLRSGGVLTNAKNFGANVNTELKRMRERGLVVNTPSGWGLSEWYPQKPKQGDVPKRKRKRGRPPGKKAAKAAPKTAPATGKRGGSWAAFAGERMKAGKTMAEAAAEWKKRKGEA